VLKSEKYEMVQVEMLNMITINIHRKKKRHILAQVKGGERVEYIKCAPMKVFAYFYLIDRLALIFILLRKMLWIYHY
jgi:hypothetical protein